MNKFPAMTYHDRGIGRVSEAHDRATDQSGLCDSILDLFLQSHIKFLECFMENGVRLDVL